MTRPSSAWANQLETVLREANIAIEMTATDVEKQKILSKFLQDLTEICRLMPIPEDSLGALKDLTKAFYDLSRGVQHSLLKVSRKAGREPSSGNEQRIRARGIALVELLKEAGVAAGTAKELVAKEFNKIGIRGRNGKRISKDTIHKWTEAAHPYGERPNERVLADQLILTFRRKWSDKPLKQGEIIQQIPQLIDILVEKSLNL